MYHAIFFKTVIVTLDMKGCICYLVKWQIHPFISKRTLCSHNPDDMEMTYHVCLHGKQSGSETLNGHPFDWQRAVFVL